MVENGKIALVRASMIVTHYIKPFRREADRHNGILMSLLLLVAETTIDCKKSRIVLLQDVAKFVEKNLQWSPIFSKKCVLRSSALPKTGIHRRCFPVSFTKFCRMSSGVYI